jgi:hypothetical protein
MAPAADARTKRVSLKARTLLRGEADKEAVEGEAVPQQQADDSILPGAPQAGAAASKRASGVSRAASISRGELLTPVFADNTAELLETQQVPVLLLPFTSAGPIRLAIPPVAFPSALCVLPLFHTLCSPIPISYLLLSAPFFVFFRSCCVSCGDSNCN